MDEQQKIREANRKAWNEATVVHQQQRQVNLKEQFAEPGYSCLDEVLTAKLCEIGVAGKAVAQTGCNNGREILSVMNLGAAEGVGFDISDLAIAEATELASVAGTNCRFVRTDVYDIGPEWNGHFDVLLITIGALSWLPDLRRFFEIAAGMLKPGGDLVIYEMHPFTYLFAAPDEVEYDPNNPEKVVYPYFRKDPWVSDKGIDYIGRTQYESSPGYSYTQTISDLLNAIAGGGFVLREFNEYAHDIANLWAHLEAGRRIPLCYLLTACKTGGHDHK